MSEDIKGNGGVTMIDGDETYRPDHPLNKIEGDKAMQAFNNWYKDIEKEYPMFQDKDGYNIGNTKALKVGWEAALLWAEDRLSESKDLGEAFSKIVKELESK